MSVNFQPHPRDRQPVDDNLLRALYWRKTRSLTVMLIAIIAAAALATLIFVGTLNEQAIFGFPLGYFLAVKGIVLLSATAIFWGCSRQEAIDREYNPGDTP